MIYRVYRPDGSLMQSVDCSDGELTHMMASLGDDFTYERVSSTIQSPTEALVEILGDDLGAEAAHD